MEVVVVRSGSGSDRNSNGRVGSSGRSGGTHRIESGTRRSAGARTAPCAS
jgi:hypothetical protein